MNGFVLHPAAYEDLDEIWEYIAADNIDAADLVREKIYETIRTLVSLPQMGHTRPDLTARQIRFHAVHDYVIAYAPNEKPLAVIAVLHGRRSPRVLAAILRKRT